MSSESVRIGPPALAGDLVAPPGLRGMVVFAHGSGSSRASPRNRQVAGVLNAQGLGTLLLDLLTPDEAADRRLVFDIALLTRRLGLAIDWCGDRPALHGVPLGLFGASTGAAAALRALPCEKRLEVVPGATHLFEEPGALDTVAWLAADWFVDHLARSATR